MSLNRFDKFLIEWAPSLAARRMRARLLAETMRRHYEAASTGRRTSGWRRAFGDANAVNAPALNVLRAHARDLVRNNPYASRGVRVIGNNTVGWGIVPKPTGVGKRATQRARDLWQQHFESTACDVEGRQNIYGIQRTVIRTTAESGEALIRRYRRPMSDGLPIPVQFQVLEPDFIDTTKDGFKGEAGGPVIQGIEYDTRGRRVAYWLYDEHPGARMQFTSRAVLGQSRRIPAEDIIHVFRLERPGQVRGITWFAPVIVKLKDFDEYADAKLMQQKIAACFTVFVTDMNGGGAPALTSQSSDDPLVETIEPGLVVKTPPGRDVKFAQPPTPEGGSFSAEVLHAIAAGLGVTYEDLTGDYSKVNFSSARMARLAHWADVQDWRWNMLIPQLCARVWQWGMETAFIAGLISDVPGAQWTPPPMPMIEPDKEGLAYTRLVRAGAMTHDEMVREQGNDPDTHWAEYAENLRRLDELGIVLDSDARRTTLAGNPRHQGAAQEADGEQSGDDETGGNGRK